MLIKKLNNQFINCDIFYRLIKIFLLCLVGLNLFSINVSSKEQKSEWSKRCTDKSKIETCQIFYEIYLKQKDKTSKLASIMLLYADEIQQNLDVLDKEKKTFALKESSKRVPVLFFDLPLNVDLRIVPFFQIDKGKRINTRFLFCKGDTGCRSGGKISEELLKALKHGKELNFYFKIYGGTKNLLVKFPLKGFIAQVRKLK
jgi:invasion protein IalB|tara:strand:- start:148 stop:750 length:603 start_codon:yes stop_codon:yes gene_type:complete